MNVDSPSNSSNSQNLSTSEVKSKYLTGKGDMDDSLSDFQEKKKLTAPKNTKKPTTSNSKPKKAPKRIRGQKDIRTALKSQKNELIAYSNEFDKVCKQSGIDIDPEQLQVAIALSKSLQQTNQVDEASQSSGTLSAQERSGKIRTTLLEYGFVVPEIKITASKSKKLKRYRKNYKLLLSSEEEKQQLISDKYSQVLFNNFDNKIVSGNPDYPNSSAQLYHIVTNISYEQIKDNSKLYIADYFEKLSNSVGCLLKDWAKIPGRPSSPVCVASKFKFHKIDYSQKELDSILSGVLKVAQKIVKNKCSMFEEEDSSNTIDDNPKTETKVVDTKMDVDCIEIVDQEAKDGINLRNGPNNYNEGFIDLTEIKTADLLTVTQNVRSCSPDIFDDEESLIIDNPVHKPDNLMSQEISLKNTTKDCNNIMHLTDSLNFNSQKLHDKPISQLSQETIATKRRSNDLMKMTECVVGSSQPIRENIIEENIDLTQYFDNEENKKPNKEQKNTINISIMDLTQSSNTDDELPFVEISGKDRTLDDTIFLNDDAYDDLKVDEKTPSCSEESCKLDSALDESQTETKLSSEKLTNSKINLIGDRSLVAVDSDDESDSHRNVELKNVETTDTSLIKRIGCNSHHLNDELSEPQNNSKVFDLTRKNSRNPSISKDNCAKSTTESFFEEFVDQHSDSSKDHTEVLCLDESSNSVSTEVSKNENVDIDLTQATDSSGNTSKTTDNTENTRTDDPSNLGKIGNVLIDYDEMFDDMVRSHESSASQSKSISSKSNITDLNNDNLEIPSTSKLVKNLSENSEVFEISDKELDYSLHKSRLDVDNPKVNFDFGGISVVDNLPDLASFRPSTGSLHRSMSDSFLPSVDIKSSKDENCGAKSPSKFNSQLHTPYRSEVPSSNRVIANTPKNGDYILKTDEVTPMLEYETMTTPERNAELDKYGLKPFKRKRAIQLLTHLYNQTHPIVASCSDDGQSPTKKMKPNTSPTKRISPKKITPLFKSRKKVSKITVSPIKDHVDDGTDKENDIYIVTSEVADVRNIECSEEDWVFQKREKAKLQSCRVPLHIAFHNYVAARFSLREAILRYEPINIDVIHKGLVTNGYRYDPKDLLKFMDKKCITVKTVDNNARNDKKHY